MFIFSEITGQHLYYISKTAEGWSWKLLWRYNDCATGFKTKAEAEQDARRHYKNLQERTAVGCRRRIYLI